MKTIYLTTPLYYVNDVPHIGHAYTTIAADILARWNRLNGKKVFFLTGTDEHGAKIAAAAEKTGESPQDFVNRIASEYKKTWTVLNISYDDFIQTSEPRHKKAVQQVFEKLKSSGDITKGIYEDWYCLHDESYFSESELIDKKCPSCGRDVQKLKEESYFFKLSKYQQSLLDHYEKHPEFLSPPQRAGEIINFVRSGLRDLSVSRTRVSWGVPIESDPSHTVYVWFDALLNYISAPPENVWPADVHLVGKEIFRFHTVIWPAMLMALGKPLPKKVFAHGWWTVEGTKMSKSLGNVVDPIKMSEEYGVDAFRYFLFREVPFGADGDFSEKSLLTRYNAELANNLGNLVQRTTTLITKNFNGLIPPAQPSSELLANVAKLAQTLQNQYENLALGGVLESLFGLMIRTNKYIDDQAPWKLTVDQKAQLEKILWECLLVIKVLAVYLHPFMPKKTQEIWERMGEINKLENDAPLILAQFSEGKLPLFSKGQTILKADPLFMRKGGRWK
ncbi:MAG: Methionine--tRNA ligase [Elusimicrobia bacterium]|nr:Methionine--tRNA ligase [Elusimicrobiota bacterium]